MAHKLNQFGRTRILMVATLLLLVIFAAAAGFIVLSATNDSSSLNSTQDTSAKLSKKSNASDIIDAADQRMSKAFTVAKSSGVTYPSGTVSLTKSDTSPAFKTGGNSYAVTPDSGHALLISYHQPDNGKLPNADSTKISNTLATALSDAKLEKITDTKGLPQNNGSYYQNDNEICSLVIAIDPITLSCNDISVYSGAYQTAKPFMSAFLAANNSVSTSKTAIGISEINVSPSKTAGYQTARVTLTLANKGEWAAFYKAPKGDWQFVKAGQDPPTCQDYTTSDAKKAYVGVDCIDTSTNSDSTLQL